MAHTGLSSPDGVTDLEGKTMNSKLEGIRKVTLFIKTRQFWKSEFMAEKSMVESSDWQVTL